MNNLQRHSVFLLLLATVSVSAGIVINQFRDHPLALVYRSKAERLQQTVDKLKADKLPDQASHGALPAKLSLEEFAAFVAAKRGHVIDARPEIFHRLGHVPGALSLPRDDFEAAYRSHKERLEAIRAPIVIYCSGASCEDSDLVKKALADLGFDQLAIFGGGWAEWRGAGMAEEVSP